MGLLDDLLGTIWSKETQDWVFERIDPDHNAAPYNIAPRPLQQREEYISIVLRSMRIPLVQKGTSKYFGAVHSFISLDHPILPENAFHVFAAPTNLRDLDAPNIDRVVQADRRLLGPTPYHGGDVRIEMALFSLKSSDLATPYASLLEGLSATAGTAILGVAAPLLPLLKTGVQLLTDATGTVSLEIGIDQTFTSPTTGCYVAARIPGSSASLAQFGVAQNGRLLDSNGGQVTAFPYFIFTIDGTDSRPDWAKVPDLAQPYAAIMEAARRGDQQEAGSLFEEMKRRVHLSFDLVPGHADFIINWVETQLKKAFPATRQSSLMKFEMPPLESLPRYHAK